MPLIVCSPDDVDFPPFPFPLFPFPETGEMEGAAVGFVEAMLGDLLGWLEGVIDGWRLVEEGASIF